MLFARAEPGKASWGRKNKAAHRVLFSCRLFNPRFPALPTFNWGFTWAASRHALLPAANKEERAELGSSLHKPPHGAVIWAGTTGGTEGLGTPLPPWQKPHHVLNTPRLWERNPARPAPLHSLPGCQMQFIRQTSVCSAQLGCAAPCRLPAASTALQVRFFPTHSYAALVGSFNCMM